MKKPGFTFSIKPFADAVVYNALLDGGLFNGQSPLHNSNAKSGTDLHRKILRAGIDMLVQVSYRRFSFSFTQMMNTPDFRNYQGHNVGNISVAAGW